MWWSTDETEINLSYIWVKFKQDEMRCILIWWCTAKLKYIWVTSESNLNEMSESDLSKKETKCSLMWWCTDKTKIHLSHIWIRFKQDVWIRFKQDLSQIWAKLKWWRLNLKFLTLILRYYTWQYMWFFDNKINEMIFIKHLLTIIQKMKRLSSRKVIFSINVILEQKWIIMFIMLEV